MDYIIEQWTLNLKKEGSLPLNSTETIQTWFFKRQFKFISFLGLFTCREILRFTSYKNYIFTEKYSVTFFIFYIYETSLFTSLQVIFDINVFLITKAMLVIYYLQHFASLLFAWMLYVYVCTLVAGNYSFIVVQSLIHILLCDPMHCSMPGFCPSLFPGVCSNSCPLSQWWYPTTSSSVIPFSSYLESVPASGSFPMNQLFTSGGQSIGASASASVLSVNIQGWFP